MSWLVILLLLIVAAPHAAWLVSAIGWALYERRACMPWRLRLWRAVSFLPLMIFVDDLE